MKSAHCVHLTIQAILVVATSSAFADFSGRVIGVSDGDTITVLLERHPVKVRLFGIDCPEKGQPFGGKAKRFTSELAFGLDVKVEEHGQDRYGRTLGDVILPDGRSLNRELVAAGMAWWYRRYSDDATLKALEAEARSAHRGLWSEPEPIPPWDWRQMKAARRE